MCFLREAITDMNYGPGSHTCDPQGKIVYSSNVYINKHMSTLGLPFLINKFTERYKRTDKMREIGWSNHYTEDKSKIEEIYKNAMNNCNLL